MPLDIQITQVDPGTFRVKLCGMLDTQSAAQLDSQMDPVLADASARSIQLELPDLKFISSIGLGLMAKFKKAIEAKGGRMVCIGAPPPIVRIFNLAKIVPKETMFACQGDADAYFAAIHKQMIENQGGGSNS